jgi:transcriptional regulator with XRE-family HTH domain
MRTEEDKSKLRYLGHKIKTIRIQKGMNQTEFANSIGKDQPCVNRLENGRVNPGYLYLQLIAKGLEIEIKDLF